jgi:hypothetical protein
MKENTFENEKNVMLPHITWMLWDDQQVFHAYNILTMAGLNNGHFLYEEYDAIFEQRPATLVTYDDVICYSLQSLKIEAQ